MRDNFFALVKNLCGICKGLDKFYSRKHKQANKWLFLKKMGRQEQYYS